MKSEDEAFEAYLEGGTALSRRYREAASATALPEALDVEIIEAGRAAGQRSTVRPLAAAGPRERRWVLPGALAASIALGVGWLATRPGPERVEPDFVLTSEFESNEVVSSEEAVRSEGIRTPPDILSSTKAVRAEGDPGRAADPIELRPGDIQPAGLEPAIASPGETTGPTQPLDEASRRLAHIDALLGKGEQDAARVMFYAFRERFPNYPVPDDLLARLGM